MCGPFPPSTEYVVRRFIGETLRFNVCMAMTRHDLLRFNVQFNLQEKLNQSVTERHRRTRTKKLRVEYSLTKTIKTLPNCVFFDLFSVRYFVCCFLLSISQLFFDLISLRRSVRSVRWQHLWFISLAIWFQRGLNASTYTLVFFMTLKSQPCAHNAYISICIYCIRIRHTSIIFRFSYLRGISPRAMVPQRNRFDRKFCDDSRTHTNKCLCVCVQHRTSVFCFQSRRRGVVLKFFQ